MREPLRRFAARQYAAYVNEQQTVVLVVRSKEQMSIEELSKIANERCPGTIFFVSDSGRIASVAALQERIEDCARAYAMPAAKVGMETRMIGGKQVLIIGSVEKNEEGVILPSRQENQRLWLAAHLDAAAPDKICPRRTRS